MSEFNQLNSVPSAGNLRSALSMGLATVAALGSLYFPSSLNGTIVSSLVPLYTVALCVLVLLYVAMNGAIRNNVYFGMLVLSLLGFFTILSPLPKLAYGAIFPYLGLCAVLVLDLRASKLPYRIPALLALCLPMLMLGWSTVLGFDDITAIQESWYQIYRDDLFENLVGWFAKPVSVFGTHSVAAFVYFALCVLMLRLGKHAASAAERVVAYILFACFAGLIPMLLSTSAFALFGLLLMMLFWNMFKRLGWRVNTMLVFLVIAVAVYLALSGYFGVDLMSDDVLDVFSSKGNGFSGRFSKGSRLEPTYTYLFRNYFQPVGITYDDVIEFGDGFIAEYILRTSVLGYALVLAMLRNFLKTNLFNKKQYLLFLIFFLIADFGYPLLTTYRVVFVLPLYMLLWRSVSPAHQGQVAEKAGPC